MVDKLLKSVASPLSIAKSSSFFTVSRAARQLNQFTMVSYSTVDNDSSGTGPVYQRIQAILSERFGPSHLEIIDESHKHAGHAAMRNDEHSETHFAVTVVSDKFASVSVVERHRMVNEALAAELDSA